jgi:LDH2 family malate/lactate/ureidoglycolate dehydrogenase
VASDLVSEKALAAGIAIVSVRRAGVSGALGYLAERAARDGLVSMVFGSTPLTVVAPGTTVPALGTNPLAIGIPRPSDNPLVLDMATSAIAFNQVMRMREIGESLPADVANGPDGSMTLDPADAIDSLSGRGRILPFGGHRGYGLALMLELMVSAGATGRTGDAKRGPVVLEPEDFGAIYLAYRPELLGNAADMQASIESLIAELDRMGARVPGERSRALREKALLTGEVEVDPQAMALLDT